MLANYYDTFQKWSHLYVSSLQSFDFKCMPASAGCTAAREFDSQSVTSSQVVVAPVRCSHEVLACIDPSDGRVHSCRSSAGLRRSEVLLSVPFFFCSTFVTVEFKI